MTTQDPLEDRTALKRVNVSIEQLRTVVGEHERQIKSFLT
jgi:hypothetical protein